MAKVTLKDIARAVGVSPTTVSLVLNGRPCRVSQPVRQKIKDVALQKHYVPNQIARSLVSQCSHSFGLVIPNIESRFFASLAHNIETLCRKQGYMLLITNSDGTAKNDAELVRLLVNRGADGIFFVASEESEADQNLVDTLEQLPCPYVMVDRFIEGLTCDSVRYDNEMGASMAVNYLIEQGHDHIAAMLNLNSNTGRDRLIGYKQALEDHGLTYDGSLVFETDYFIPDAYTAAHDVLKSGVSAVFASSDNIALGLLKRITEERLSVPKDISVVSYDNSAADSIFEPALTSIEQNVPELSRNAVELLMARVNAGKDAPVQGDITQRVLKPRLVIKDSVKNINPASAHVTDSEANIALL
ncbi:LacI family DNA-binding transcriptional regulator [Atopobium sp. oral taxon 416]|uniref:LacI family DNA-binding transcriptional regulator n=1 Tax=Atopobium sp. oral taxon 416 TaxID=712157 RepID=UPI001BA80C15|nr:LacI family DNA-binding transcriptional regulator [Atopobium sp. oral taxon 416]QUC04530.1 LacI family DNA-binding transcriptional regulator [Atopobium sp. oral taxon 416]